MWTSLIMPQDVSWHKQRLLTCYTAAWATERSRTDWLGAFFLFQTAPPCLVLYSTEFWLGWPSSPGLPMTFSVVALRFQSLQNPSSPRKSRPVGDNAFRSLSCARGLLQSPQVCSEDNIPTRFCHFLHTLGRNFFFNGSGARHTWATCWLIPLLAVNSGKVI